MASVFSCIYRFTGGSFWGIDHVAQHFLFGSSSGNAEGRSAITDVFATKGLNRIESKGMNRCEGYEELFMYSMAIRHAMPQGRVAVIGPNGAGKSTMIKAGCTCHLSTFESLGTAVLCKHVIL